MVIIVAVIYIPIRLGGWGHIFSVADTHLKATNPKTGKPNGSLILQPAGMLGLRHAGPRLGAGPVHVPALDHRRAGREGRNVIRRNAALLPAYSLVLGLIALLGYMALAAPGVPAAVKAHGANAQLSVPFLFQQMFPSWFAGVAFAAIAIGALVPAAIMSIAAANLFTRNIYKEYFRPNASAAEQTRASQWASLVVKFGALLFVLFVKQTYAINFQLLGGIWILQTFPAIVFGPLHPLVPPLGAARRLGRGHGLRHHRRVPAARPRRTGHALRRVHGHPADNQPHHATSGSPDW